MTLSLAEAKGAKCSTNFWRTAMNTVLTIQLLVVLLYYLIQFARHEHIQEDYEDAVIDVEGRLEWARTRSSFPFGMQAQLEVSCELLGKAKCLWKANKWHQAYRVALQAQNAMNKAQSLYCAVVKERQ